MTFGELLATVIGLLDRAAIPYTRRQPADLLGTAGFITTAEDLVIAKLEWAAVSGSDRQLRDVAGILAVTETLDAQFIERWVAAMGVAEIWQRVRDDARP